MERENFKSRIGFILVSAGCAIGIGNVWKFPYVTGANGGGIFVLFYLLFLITLGIPVMTMEFAVGRASRKSSIRAFKALEPAGTKWHLHGWACLVGNTMLMMYYTTVSGWMLSYFVKFAGGTFSGKTVDDVDGIFGAMLASPTEMGLFMAVTVLGGFLVCSLGIQNGVERVTKVMMSGLLFLIVILAIHSIMLPGSGEGIRFYLLPDPARAAEVGLGHVATAAMNQAFFTLSLGICSMEIFGSYIGKERTLASEAGWICVLDTFVALTSGLIIFPACFSFGVEPNAGPPLIFITLPRVFLSMAGGRIWGTLFFLFMTFASFSTVIAVFENIIATCMDHFEWDRKKTVAICCVFLLIASMPCVLGYNVWSDLRIIGDRDVLDSEDFIVSNILLPLGSLVFTLFCCTKWGWGFDKYREEVNTGEGWKIPEWFKYWFRFGIPVLVLVILVQGLV